MSEANTDLRELAAAARQGDAQAAMTLTLEVNFGSIDNLVSFVMGGQQPSREIFDLLADALADARDLVSAR